ncbi:MAG: DNA alkylation repair protein [Firmicutes bacterium]|nr:DNA alkylation repair protein [Bacillota bacterium]
MIREEIRAFIIENGEEKFKKFHIGLTPGIDEQHTAGVRVPVLRDYAKKLHKNGVVPEDIDTVFYEEIMLRGMLTGLIKYRDFNEFKNAVTLHLPYITNWALCDTFCGGLKQTKKYMPEMLKYITPFLTSENEYEARFAAVMLLSYYINDEYIDSTLKLLKKVKHEGYYAKMAVAWALSVAFVKYYKKTREFIQTNKFDKFTHNKAIQKACESYRVTDEQKEELRKLKI